MKKTKVKMNQPVYLGMSILDISETLMYEFWYDYNQSITKKQNYALLLTFSLKTFLKILIMMLSHGMIHLIMIKMIKNLFQ